MTSQKPAYPDPPLTDGVILVRPWTMADLAAIEQASHDVYIPTVTSVPSVYTEDEGRAFIERQWQLLNDGRGISLCIADGQTDTALGFIGIGLHSQRQGRASMGYWLVPGARGRGLSIAAVCLVCVWAFAALDIARLELLIEPWNIASQRVAEHAGFRREDVERSYKEINGRRINFVMYARVAGDNT